MNSNELKELTDRIEFNSHALQTSLLKHHHHSFSNIFANEGNKVLGQALYDVLKDVYIISKEHWNLDKQDIVDWIDEIQEELKDY